VDLAADPVAPERRIFDCTVHLRPAEVGYDAASGLNDFKAGHIPHAQFLDLIEAASDTTTGLPFSAPPIGQLEALFRRLGVDDESDVVFYSTGDPKWATRAWWLAHYCGHRNIRVLDGGLEGWVEQGFPVSTEDTGFPPGHFKAVDNSQIFASQDDVSNAIADGSICTINALSPDVYSGLAKITYGRKGHIPESGNLHYSELLDGWKFKSPTEIRNILRARGILESPRIIAYCGSGISATVDAFACLLVGHRDVAVYDGSMTEWVRNEALPVRTGNEP